MVKVPTKWKHFFKLEKNKKEDVKLSSQSEGLGKNQQDPSLLIELNEKVEANLLSKLSNNKVNVERKRSLDEKYSFTLDYDNIEFKPSNYQSDSDEIASNGSSYSGYNYQLKPKSLSLNSHELEILKAKSKFERAKIMYDQTPRFYNKDDFEQER